MDTNKANDIFRRLDPWQCDALDIAWPDDVEADLQLAMAEGTDGLIDRIQVERRALVDGSALLHALGAYRRLLDEAIGKEAA